MAQDLRSFLDLIKRTRADELRSSRARSIRRTS